MFRSGVIGSPVSHSLSPAIHRAAFRYLDIDGTSMPIDSDGMVPDELKAQLLAHDALSVTFPLKENIAGQCDELDSVAQSIGAVNSVLIRDGRIFGRNFDGNGFLRALIDDLDFDVRDANVVVLGAGGAARSVIDALVRGGAGSIDVLVRQDRGQGSWFADGRVSVTTTTMLDADLVINATPSSLTNELLELPRVHSSDETAFVDLTYSPPVTPWMLECAKTSERVTNGLGMLVWQAKLQLDWWLNAAIPIEVLKSAVTS